MNHEARTAGAYQTTQKPAAVDRKRKKSQHTQNDLTNGHSLLSSSSNSSSNNHNATWMTGVQMIDPRNTFEITKALKTNICRFFKSNKIDIAASAAHQKEHRPMSVLDSFTPKPKYFQASFYPYEEPSSGEQSPLLPLSSDESEGNQQFRSSDEEEEDEEKSERRNKRNRKDEQRRRKDRNSNSINRYSRSSSSSRSNTSSSSNSSNSSSSRSSSSSSSSRSSSQSRSHSNPHKSHKKSNKSSRSSSHSSCSNESPKFKTIKEKDANKTPAYEVEYNNNTSHEDIEHSKQQKNQLSSLLSNSAGQRKLQASTSAAGSATNSQQKPKISQEAHISQDGIEKEEQLQGEGKAIESSKKKQKKENKEEKKKKEKKEREKSHSKRNHSKEQPQSQSKRHPKSQSHSARSQVFKERASVEDVVMNLFERQSHEITQSLSAAENHPSIPKLYIEDPLQECDPDAVYKIAVTIARQNEYKQKKHRISNFTVFSVKKQSEESNNTNSGSSASSSSVRVLLLEFYKKTTALRVGMALEKLSQHYPYQLDAGDYHYLPSSLSFKWALDRKKQMDYSQSYFSCVIRNLPEECSESRLKSFIQAKTASSVRILSVEETRLIKNSICSIVRVASFEEAEHLCVVLNRSLYPSYSSTLRVKCHLHPECCHTRAQAARDDPTKLYFTPKSAAVRCKLIKCRMDSEWMECKTKQKMQGSTVKGATTVSAAVGDSDEGLSSNEESFPEYASLYEGNADILRQKLPTPREVIQSILKNTSCLFAGSQPIPPMPMSKATTNPFVVNVPAVFEAHPSRNMPSSIHSENMAQSLQQQQQQAQIYNNSNSLLASLKLAVTMNNNNKDKEESLKGRKPQDIQGLEAAPGKKMKLDSHEEEGSMQTQSQSNFPTGMVTNKNPMSNSSLRAFPQVSQQMQQQQQQVVTQPSGAIPTPHALLLSSNSSEKYTQQQQLLINPKNLGPHQSRQVVLPLPLNPPPPGFVHQHLVQPPQSQQQSQPQFQQQQSSLPQPQFQQQQGFAGRGQPQSGMGNAIPMQHMLNNNPLVQQQQQQQHHQHLPLSNPVIAMPRISQQQQYLQQSPQQFIQGQGIVSHSQFPQGQVVQPNPSQFPNVQHPQMPQQQQQFIQQHQQQQPIHHPHLPQQPQKHYVIAPPQYATPIAQPPIGYIQQPQQLPQPVIPQILPMVPPAQSYPSHLISQQPCHISTAPEGLPSPNEEYQPMPPAGTTPKTPSLPPSPPSDPPSPE